MPKVIVFGNTLVNTMGLIRSIGEKGIHVILMLEPCIKGNCFVHFSKYVKKVHWLQKMEDAIEILHHEYWNELEKIVILCGSDLSICLLDAYYDELKEHFFIFNAKGEQGRINFFMDKSNQFPIAEKSGLKLIKTWHITDVEHLPSDINYPCLIKGNNSITSTKSVITICMNKSELESQLEIGKDYLVQKYIEKDYELDIVGLSCEHGRKVFINAVVRKLRETFTRQSDYICLEDISNYAELPIESMKTFISLLGYEGIFSIEFLRSKDEYYFLEANLRNDGVGYLYTIAGLNYPYMWVTYNREKSKLENIRSGIIKKKYYLMSEGDLYNLFSCRVKFTRWFKECLDADAHFVLNKNDIKPFICLMYIHFRQMFKKVFKHIKWQK